MILIDIAKAAIRNLSANFTIKSLIYLAGIWFDLSVRLSIKLQNKKL